MADVSPPPGHPGGHLTLRDLCCLFCCPPCPSSIVAKLAFMPPQPTYEILPDPDNSERYTLRLSERSEWPFPREDLRNVDVFFEQTTRGNKIAVMYVRALRNASSKYTLLFSHGNAVDLGQMCSFYYGLGARLGCNVLSYDYSGYGASGGKPREKNIYADITAAWNALRTRYNVPAERIVLYGQSIGTVPTVHLASKQADVAAVVLHSPLMSGMRVAFPDTSRTYCFDAFPTIDKVAQVQAPTLIIHGTEDEVIDFSHGLGIYDRCPRPVEPLWIPGAGHNDVELHSAYLERLRNFIEYEVDLHSRERATERRTNKDNSGGQSSSGRSNGGAVTASTDASGSAAAPLNNNAASGSSISNKFTDVFKKRKDRQKDE